MNYNLLMENWRKFVEQEENPVSEPGEEEKEAGVVDQPLEDEVADSDFVGPAVPDDYLPPPETPHVDRAKAQMARWGGRKDYDKTPADEMPHDILSEYYNKVSQLGLHFPQSAVTYWINQNKQGNYPAWSAMFINYCMQDKEKFIEMQKKHHFYVKKGPFRDGSSHHGYYYAGRARWKLLTEGNLDDPYEWIFFTIKEAKEIGYIAKPGDLCFAQVGYRRSKTKPDHFVSIPIQNAVSSGQLARGFLHGDIITQESTELDSPSGMKAIGGNLSSTCKYATSRRYAFMSQRPEVKDKVRAAYGLEAKK